LFKVSRYSDFVHKPCTSILYAVCTPIYSYICVVYFTILHGRRAYIRYLYTGGLDLTRDTFYIRTVIILRSPYYSSELIIGDCFSFLSIPSSTVYLFIFISIQRNHWSFYIKCSVLVFTTNRHASTLSRRRPLLSYERNVAVCCSRPKVSAIMCVYSVIFERLSREHKNRCETIN